MPSQDRVALSDLAEFNYLSKQERERERDRSRGSILERIKQDRKELEDLERNEAKRKKILMEKYVWPLVDAHDVRRRQAAERISREITSKEERIEIAKIVAEVSEAMGWQKRRDWNKKSFMRRFGEKLYELPEGYARGSWGIAERLTGLGRAVGGADDDQKAMVFRQLVESAYQSGNPEKSKEDNFAQRALRGGAEIAPQIVLGATAYGMGGAPALGTEAAAEAFAPVRQRLIAEGVSPGYADVVGTATAGSIGAAETLVPVPFLGRSKFGKAGGRMLEKGGEFLAKRGLIGETGKRAIGHAGRAAGEYAGETFEEGIQGGAEAAGSLVGTLETREFEGRTPIEIPEEFAEGVEEAALPMLPVSLLGGGMMFAQSMQSEAAREQIKKWAQEKHTPSRREWKKAGLPPGAGVTVSERKKAVKQAAEAIYRAEQAAVEPAAEEVPAAAPEGAFTRQEPTQETRELRGRLEAAIRKAAAIPKEIDESTEETKEEDSLKQDVADFLAEEAGMLPFKELEEPDEIAGETGQAALDLLKSDNPEHDRRVEKADVADPSDISFVKKTLDVIKQVGRSFTRAKMEIPSTPEFAPAREVFRLIKAIPAASQQEVIKSLSEVVTKNKLGPTQLKLFKRYLLTRNQRRTLMRVSKEDTSKLDPGPRRYGFKSIEEVEERERALTALVESTPKVKRAFLDRGRIVEDLVSRMVEEGVIGEDALDDVEGYMHQQIDKEKYMVKYVSSKLGQGKKGFQKKRLHGMEELGEELDPNTSYFKPEATWMSGAYSALEVRRLAGMLIEHYDRFGDFIEEAQKSGVHVNKIAKDNGYEVVRKKKFLGYIANPSVDEAIMDEAEDMQADELGMTDEEVGIAQGEQEASDLVAMPKEIVAQMEADNRAAKPGWIFRIAKDINSFWKHMILMMPHIVVGYQLRNYLGDLDPLLAVLPQATIQQKRAFKQLKQLQDPTEPLDKVVKTSLDLGVIGSGFGGTELGRVAAHPLFRKLAGIKDKSLILKPINWYVEKATAFTQARENLLRHSAFLTYKKLLDDGKGLEDINTGAAKEADIREIQSAFGNDIAAGHMARELFIDYGNLSEMNQVLRDYLLPFWSFVAGNTKRVPMVLSNLWKTGGRSKRLGPILGRVAVLRMFRMYAAMQIFNNFVWPVISGEDDEAKLSLARRAIPHLWIWKFKDGRPALFNRVGSLGDFMEWFGASEALHNLPRLANGQLDWKEMAVDTPKAALQKLIGLLRPEIKAPIEVITGKSLYPEATSGRTVDRGELLFGSVGLNEAYRAAKGRALGTGERAGKDYWMRYFIKPIDPGEEALSDIYEFRDLYLKSVGKFKKGSYPISAMAPAHAAARAGNKDAFMEWAAGHLEKEGLEAGGKKFIGYLQRLDPLKKAGMNEKDRYVFEYKFLKNDQQRDRLQQARNHVSVLRDRMLLWYSEARKNAREGG
jgi:hypothetical protein